jgi:hypothetical protein
MVAAAVVALAIVVLAPATASAWAPASQATVHPGVMTFTDGAQCTSNFVFTQGSDVYLGQAAHCSGTGGATETNGCDSGSLPVGTPVEIDGASRPGTMVYNSWITMQAGGETNADTCDYNDFALVRIDPADVAKVNPSVPGFGGPTGGGEAADGSTVYSYGNSSLRGGVTKLSPKQGTVVATEGNGWSRTVYTVSPRSARRLGERLPERQRPGVRRAEHAPDPPHRGVERGRGPQQRAGLHARAQLAVEHAARPRHGAVQSGPGGSDRR